MEATATSALGGHCPRRPRPAKCENFCSTASASCDRPKHSVPSRPARKRGAGSPHNRADVPASLAPASCRRVTQRQRESTAVNLMPHEHGCSHITGRQKRQDRQGNPPHQNIVIENKHCRALEPEGQSRRTSSEANPPILYQHRAPQSAT